MRTEKGEMIQFIQLKIDQIKFKTIQNPEGSRTPEEQRYRIN